MQNITSSKNPRFKQAIQLHSSRGRKQQGRIIVFGWVEILRAVESGIHLKELFLCPDLATEETISKLDSVLADADTTRFELPSGLFEKLMFGSRSDGVIAIADRPFVGLDSFPLDLEGLLLVVQSLENPGNLGAIVRSADGAGAGGIIVVDSITDIFHPNSIRASMGTVFSAPIADATSEKLRAWLTRHKIRTMVARPDAVADLFEVDLTGRCAVVLGNEALGVSDCWKSENLAAVKLPMLGLADSLNVSVSASVFCYEALRQRKTKGRKKT